MWLKVVGILVFLVVIVVFRRSLARWARYTYFMRFSILLWLFPLILVWANDPTRARSFVSGIVTPSRWPQYLCVAFFLISSSAVALILARIVVINGKERFGDDCPRLLEVLLADENARCEWIAPLASQLNTAMVFWYFFANGSKEGVDAGQIAKGLAWGAALAIAFWYTLNALYYLTYRPDGRARMAAQVGRAAARTLLFPRTLMLLGSGPGQDRPGDALEMADLSVSLRWIRHLFQVPGFRWLPDGDLYECHYFSILAAFGFFGLYWVMWPLTAPVQVAAWPWVFVILYLLGGLAVVAVVFSAKPDPHRPQDRQRLRIWKAVLAVAVLAFGAAIPLLYFSQDAERFPILALVLILVISCVWTLGGIAFFADRYRIPVLTTMVVLAVVPRMLHWDNGKEEHYLSTAQSPSPVILPTPDQILNEKLGKFPDRPLIIVTATGGGIHAAAWTTAVLAKLEGEFAEGGQQENFHDHVLLLSTVSGGSAGLYTYLRELDAKTNGGQSDWERMTTVAGCSSLESVGWGLVYYDIPKAFVPLLPYLKSPSPGVDDLETSPLFKDRTWALRKAFARNLSDPFCLQDPDSGLSVPMRALEQAEQTNRPNETELTLANLRAAGASLPAFTMNTTTVENGERFLLANYKIPDNVLLDQGPNYKARSFLATFGPNDSNPNSRSDLPLATAAQMSATFPVVSSQARVPLALDAAPNSVHFADGGYYDNDGTASAIEFLRYALGRPPTPTSSSTAPEPSQNAAKNETAEGANARGPVRILLIEIRNSDDIQGSVPECIADHDNDSKFLWNLFDQAGGPLEGFMNAGHGSITARDQSALELLEHAYNTRLEVHAMVFGDLWAQATAKTDPLNWSLTPGQQKEVKASAIRSEMRTLYTSAKQWFDASPDFWKNAKSEGAIQAAVKCPGQ